MQQGQRPIYVLAAPRTGSTLLTEIVYRAFRSRFHYQGNLQEIFSQPYLTLSDQDIRSLLNQVEQTTYCFKLLSFHTISVNQAIKQDVLLRLNQRYQPVYIQRRNIIEQLLSWQHVLQNFTGSIQYDPDQTTNMLSHIELYNDIVKRYPSCYPCVYYEDLVGAVDRCKYICRIFQLDQESIHLKLRQELNSISTNHILKKTRSYAQMVVNQDEFQQHIYSLRDRIRQLEG